ncbi:MAG: hypothetical protein Q9195_003644 [Heterodermia aff. obscurata]
MDRPPRNDKDPNPPSATSSQSARRVLSTAPTQPPPAPQQLQIRAVDPPHARVAPTPTPYTVPPPQNPSSSHLAVPQPGQYNVYVSPYASPPPSGHDEPPSHQSIQDAVQVPEITDQERRAGLSGWDRLSVAREAALRAANVTSGLSSGGGECSSRSGDERQQGMNPWYQPTKRPRRDERVEVEVEEEEEDEEGTPPPPYRP